jgi:hypothetical protein
MRMGWMRSYVNKRHNHSAGQSDSGVSRSPALSGLLAAGAVALPPGVKVAVSSGTVQSHYGKQPGGLGPGQPTMTIQTAMRGA